MASKSMIERVKEVMKDPTRIRNVATSSHVHHGKCVSGDTLIITLRRVLNAKEFFDLASKYGKLVKKDENEEIYDISKFGFKTMSITFDGKIEINKILYVWRLRNDDKLIKIKLLDGREVKVTPMHKFICWSNNKIQEIEAKDLSVGDMIIAPSKILSKELSLKELKELFFEKLSEDYGFLVYLEKTFRKELHEKIIKANRKKVWKFINSKLPFLSFYHGVWKGRFRLNDYKKIIEYFGYEKSFAYDKIEFLSYRKGLKRYGTRTSPKIKLPKTYQDFLELFYLIGLMFGDGSVNLTFDNENDLLLNRVREISERIFGIKTKLRKYKNRCRRIYLNGGNTLKRVFEILFRYPLKEKAKNLDIPSYFFNLPSIFISNFLRGYFDTDGYVHQQVVLTSASENVLKKIQLLLLKFGILSYIRKKDKYWYLKISGKNDLESFKSIIGFSVSYKSQKLSSLSLNARMSKIFTNQLINSIIPLPIVSIETISNEKYVYDFTVEETHNFLANGLFIHNTTLTDNLMAGAGMLAEEMAGKVMYTWFDEQERKRQLTIYGANVSMVHNYEGKDYLINLVDTPGHVDFGGDVTRAMRAVDGTIVLVCGVEGIMPQTETVFRQALRERVKPVLFINKVDRLIKELKLTPEMMMKRFEEIIRQVNELIVKYVDEEFKTKWLVNVQDGSVAFGSAYKRWAISIPFMKKTGITFKQIIKLTQEGREDELAKIAPLHQVVLDMIIKHLPSPIEAQKYRIPKIWQGDLNSEMGKQLLNCDANGKLAAIVTKMVPDPHVGFVATARIFSGKVFKGKEVYLIGNRKKKRIQQVAIYKGIQRIPVDEVPAGNIVAIVGIPEAYTGESICEPDFIIEPFAEIKHIFEPVVTKSIEPKNPMELPKLINALNKIAKEDATLQVKINQETGEYLVSGLGELHLEAKVENKLKEMGIEVEMSPPIVVYRETVLTKSPVVEGKSPNKHNKLYFTVEPMPDSIYQAMKEGKLPERIEVKKKNLELFRKLEKYGLSYEEAKRVLLIHNRNIFIDATRGVQFLNEVIEMIKDAFEEVMEDGPLAREPVTKVIVKLVDAQLHEDSIHRGPGQIMPATRYAIRQAMLRANATLLEPKQIIRIDVPSDVMSNAIREIEGRRGQVLNISEEHGATVITAKVPVAEMFGFDAALKSATSGRGFYSLIDIVFEKLPNELFEKVVKQIRQRKGLPAEIPKPE